MFQVTPNGHRYGNTPAKYRDTRRSPYVSSRASSTPPIRRHRRVKMVVALCVLLFLALIAHGTWSKHVAAEEQALRVQQAQEAKVAAAKSAVFTTQVNQVIADNAAIDVSVAIVTKDGTTKSFGDSSAFNGASTGKLITAADYLHHVERGTAKLNQQIDGQNAQELLRLMIVNSDDSAWQSLNNYLTHPDLDKYALSIGLDDYSANTDSFTAVDIAHLLQKLQNGSLVNSSHRNLLFQYMKAANHREFIVGAVPSADKVYHKIGLIDDTVNDAAIITKPGSDVVLVVFTNGHGIYNWPDRADMMQAITKDALQAYL